MAAERTGWRKWAWEQRSAARLGYVLHMSTRLLTSFISLFWIGRLVDAMGIPLNSLYLAVQSIFSLGNLGDLGVGGVVAIPAGPDRGGGPEKEEEPPGFLISARLVFLIFAFVAALTMILLSP